MAPKPPTKADKKIAKVMGEFKSGSLHGGKGKNAPLVHSRAQAIAIALSQAKVAAKTAAMKKKG